MAKVIEEIHAGGKSAPRYKRVLVKMSGEALMGAEDYGIDAKMLKRIAG